MALYERQDFKGFLEAGGHVHEWIDIQEGILPPVVQSIGSLVGTKRSIEPNYATRLYIDVKTWRSSRWNLPSNGSSYELCGHVWYDEGRGCLSVKNHPGGKIYVRLVGATCFRAECPICYQKWASREAGAIENKFKRLSRNNAEAKVKGLGRPIHVVVSVPEAEAHLMKDDFPALRRKVYAIAKRAGIKGGCAIFHPFANDKMHEETPEKILIDKSTGDFDLISLKVYFEKINRHVNFWYVRPHFHLICYGWIDEGQVPEIHEDTGYVVKNLGVRDSVRMTAFYQLSHCGIKKGFQAVTWFGALSNRNYHKLNPLPKFKPTRARCPECGVELRPVLWDPDLPLMLSRASSTSPLEGLREGGHWIDPGGWRYLKDGEKLHPCLIRSPDDVDPV